jgi:hypothetical protein
MENNRLTGNIPASLGGLQKLEELVLHGNRLSGSLGLVVYVLRMECFDRRHYTVIACYARELARAGLVLKRFDRACASLHKVSVRSFNECSVSLSRLKHAHCHGDTIHVSVQRAEAAQDPAVRSKPPAVRDDSSHTEFVHLVVVRWP